MKELVERVQREVAKVVVGRDDAVETAVSAVVLAGHVLIEGVPGSGKTLLAAAVARALNLEFRRVQFTPDMLPSDLTGTMTLRGGELVFRPGPVFTNVLLADEINRTPPRTQAALLEAMQEGQISVEGRPEPLPDPFTVLATQNPIEYEGTYPLPEAQLDRFMVKLELGYPPAEVERAILTVERHGVGSGDLHEVQPVSSAAELRTTRAEVDGTAVAGEVLDYTVRLVRQTRELPSVALGASSRAAVHLLGAAKAAARIAGRDFVTPDDVASMAPAVLAHRLILRPEAELERFDVHQALRSAMAAVPVPR